MCPRHLCFPIWSGSGPEEEDEDDGKPFGSRRDHGKARKYKKLLDPKAIPEHIREMMEVESEKSEQPRKQKTALIKKLLMKDNKGGFQMIANQPVIENFEGGISQEIRKRRATRNAKNSVFVVCLPGQSWTSPDRGYQWRICYMLGPWEAPCRLPQWCRRDMQKFHGGARPGDYDCGGWSHRRGGESRHSNSDWDSEER